jgi:beta-glucosidase
VKRLRAFEKINLQAGESKRVSFEIPVSRLAFVNLNNQKVLEKGTFTLRIGPLSTDFSLENSSILE